MSDFPQYGIGARQLSYSHRQTDEDIH